MDAASYLKRKTYCVVEMQMTSSTVVCEACYLRQCTSSYEATMGKTRDAAPSEEVSRRKLCFLDSQRWLPTMRWRWQSAVEPNINT